MRKSAIAAVFFILAVTGAAAAREPAFGAEGMTLGDLKASQVSAVSAPAPAPLSKEQRLAEAGRSLGSRRSDKENDTAARLFEDTTLAIKAYEYCFPGERVTYGDNQDFMSPKFYLNTGLAQFNPDKEQTNRLERALDALMPANPSQARVIFEGLIAARGNLTLATGSLAELFFAKRGQYLPHVRDMAFAGGKNYYRFAGLFIGLHPALIRLAGGPCAYANIVGNPVVYAGAEIVEWWAGFFRTGKTSGGVNTLNTLGPDGRGNLVDKIPELNKGLDAAARLRKAGKIKF